MPESHPSLLRLSDLLLFVAIVIVAIGLGAVTAGVSRPESLGMTVPGDPFARDWDGSSWTPAPSPGLASQVAKSSSRRGRQGALPVAEATPRYYLSKMTTMMRRRPVAPPIVDPYQASLHPAVYLPGSATPVERSAASAP